MMAPSSFARLLASAVILAGLSACGGADKTPGTSTTTETTTAAESTAPAAEATAPANPGATAPPATTTATPAAVVTYASLTGDAVKGEKTFGVCKTCHVAEKGINHVGPTLWGVVGRHSGSIESYKYSPANKNSGLVWTEAELFKYLEAPQAVIPGTYMAYAGMRNPQDRADVIAYLKTKA
jgi:cytochrome c